MTRTPSVFPPRPFRTSGVANVVAPSKPLGRAGSALAVTAVLVGVQCGLVAARAAPDLCRLAGVNCSPAQTVFGGRVLEGQHQRISQARRAGTRVSGPASSARSSLANAAPTTVALRTPAPAVTNDQSLKAGKINLAGLRSSAAPKKAKGLRKAA